MNDFHKQNARTFDLRGACSSSEAVKVLVGGGRANELRQDIKAGPASRPALSCGVWKEGGSCACFQLLQPMLAFEVLIKILRPMQRTAAKRSNCNKECNEHIQPDSCRCGKHMSSISPRSGSNTKSIDELYDTCVADGQFISEWDVRAHEPEEATGSDIPEYDRFYWVASIGAKCSDGMTFLKPLPQTTGEEASFNGENVYYQEAFYGQPRSNGAWDRFIFRPADRYKYVQWVLDL